MNNNTVGALLGWAATCLGGIMLGYAAGASIAKQQLLDAGVGYYDTRTGDFAARKCAALAPATEAQ